ncbi:MAG: hypothetical protein RL322_2898 [Pseudomonadota bacterium]|jgi:uncharacterized peroxidase-related enzyme
MSIDFIDRMSGLEPGSAVHALRHRRDKLAAATQAFHQMYFEGEVNGLSMLERLLIAWQVSRMTPAPDSAAYFRDRLSRYADGTPLARVMAQVSDGTDPLEASAIDDPRLSALARFAAVLAARPVDGDRTLLMTLPAAGVSTPGIIAAAQLIAYVAWQTRVVAALRALASAGTALGQGDAGASTAPRAGDTLPSASAALAAAASGAPASAGELNIAGFTSASLDWRGWLDLVDVDHASALQLEVLDESHPKARTSEYYLTLIHQPDILRQRSIVFNASMYAPGGMSRAERELGATVTSRVNACVYCASVHAQRFEQLARRNDVIAQVFADPASAGTTARERAIVRYSMRLTAQPDRVDAATIEALRAEGLRDDEILDLSHSVAIFAWANRLMLNLGEPVFPRA